MTFPVNGTIPGPNDLLSQSQGDIQTNFQNIVGWSSVDHVQYGSTNAGTHEQVTIVTPQVAPAPASTTGIITTQTVTNSELFYTNSTKNMQISNSLLTASSGAGMLPGGLQIRVGTGTGSSAGTPNAISPAFPIATLSVVCTSNVLAVNIFNVTFTSPSSFTVRSSGASTFYYIAVGY